MGNAKSTVNSSVMKLLNNLMQKLSWTYHNMCIGTCSSKSGNYQLSSIHNDNKASFQVTGLPIDQVSLVNCVDWTTLIHCRGSHFIVTIQPRKESYQLVTIHFNLRKTQSTSKRRRQIRSEMHMDKNSDTNTDSDTDSGTDTNLDTDKPDSIWTQN